jgi:hypothetical protein
MWVRSVDFAIFIPQCELTDSNVGRFGGLVWCRYCGIIRPRGTNFRAELTYSRGHINSRICVFLIARTVVWCPFDFNTAVSFNSAQNDIFARAYKFAQLRFSNSTYSCMVSFRL